MFGLKIEDRSSAGREVIVYGRVFARMRFHMMHPGVPAAQPHCWIIARREERDLEIFETLFFRQRRIAGAVDRLAHFRSDGLLGGAGRDFASLGRWPISY